MAICEGATIQGKGFVTHKDGTVTHFELNSTPLTVEEAEQAEKLNIPEKDNGGNTPSNS